MYVHMFCTIMYLKVFRAVELHNVVDIERESNSDSTYTCREAARSRRAEASPHPGHSRVVESL